MGRCTVLPPPPPSHPSTFLQAGRCWGDLFFHSFSTIKPPPSNPLLSLYTLSGAEACHFPVP